MAEIEFFQAYVGIAARLGYSLTASPPRYGVRSAHLALKKSGRLERGTVAPVEVEDVG